MKFDFDKEYIEQGKIKAPDNIDNINFKYKLNEEDFDSNSYEVDYETSDVEMVSGNNKIIKIDLNEDFINTENFNYNQEYCSYKSNIDDSIDVIIIYSSFILKIIHQK